METDSYNFLFEPCILGPIEMKNRFIRSATSDNLADEDGGPSEAMIRYFSHLAENEVAMINTGVVRPFRSWFGRFNVLTFADASLIPRFKTLTDAVHEYGSKVTAQMTPYFARVDTFLAPTAPVPGLLEGVPQPLEATTQEIKNVVSTYGRMAGWIRRAGFDAVQVHAAHGYGLHQFLSPFTNRRHDKYGGNGENRFRIVKEIREAVAREAGADFPIWIKLTTGDFKEGAMDMHDVLDVAERCVHAGFFAMEPSCGSLVGYWKSRGPDNDDEWTEGYNLERIAAIKAAVSIPVVAVGGFRRLEMIRSVVRENRADFISMSRPLLHEPGLILRWKNGDHAPSGCTRCDGCFEMFWRGKNLRCVEQKEHWKHFPGA